MRKLYCFSILVILLTQFLGACQDDSTDRNRAETEQTNFDGLDRQAPSSKFNSKNQLLGVTQLEPARSGGDREAGEESVARGDRSKAAPLSVSYRAGRLSISVANQPLGDVLDAVAAATEVVIVTAGDIGETRVSVELQDLTPEQALRQLLQRFDTFFLYRPGENGASKCTSVWAYPQGEGKSLRPASSEAGVSVKEMELALNDHDPLQRARAYDALIERNGMDTEHIVVKGLSDPNDLVRARVLSKALTVGGSLETGVLMGLLQSDPSPEVRSLALDAAFALLANDAPTLRMLAEIAVQDSSDMVSGHAREILAQQADPASSQEPVAESMEWRPPAAVGKVIK